MSVLSLYRGHSSALQVGVADIAGFQLSVVTKQSRVKKRASVRAALRGCWTADRGKKQPRSVQKERENSTSLRRTAELSDYVTTLLNQKRCRRPCVFFRHFSQTLSPLARRSIARSLALLQSSQTLFDIFGLVPAPRPTEHLRHISREGFQRLISTLKYIFSRPIIRVFISSRQSRC